MPKTAPRRPRADWKALREALWRRSGGRCEVSGKPLDFETFDAHHRRNKGMGGTSRPDTDTLPNLLALDPIVHNGGPGSVHADRPRSELHGWLVPKLSPHPLTAVPVVIWIAPGVRQHMLLTDAGQRLPAGPLWQPAEDRFNGRWPAVATRTGEEYRQLTHQDWPAK